MRNRILGALVAPLVVLGLGACSVEQTEEGEMPDVEVEEGNMPEYDVDAADVEVGTDTSTVITPDVNIEPPTNTGN